MAARHNLFGGSRDENGRPRMNPIVAIAAMILAPLAASLVQMAISRSRQYRRLLSPAVGRIVAAVVEHQQAVTGPFHRSADSPHRQEALHGARVAEVGVLRHEIGVLVPRRTVPGEVERREVCTA
jgi:hypothetical protein